MKTEHNPPTQQPAHIGDTNKMVYPSQHAVEAAKALDCLYIAVERCIADDVNTKVRAYIAALEKERDNWMEDCRRKCCDIEYYQGLLDQIGNLFGEQAMIADDGSKMDSVIRAKVPELVRELHRKHC